MLTAIILAAGRSERMGTQKLLLPLNGEALIVGVVDEVLADTAHVASFCAMLRGDHDLGSDTVGGCNQQVPSCAGLVEVKQTTEGTNVPNHPRREGLADGFGRPSDGRILLVDVDTRATIRGRSFAHDVHSGRARRPDGLTILG